MPEDGLDRMAEMTPAAASLWASRPARAGDETHEEAHLVPAPDQQAVGEGSVDADDAGVVSRGNQAPQGQHRQGRASNHAPAEGAPWQAVEIEDHARAEPP